MKGKVLYAGKRADNLESFNYHGITEHHTIR